MKIVNGKEFKTRTFLVDSKETGEMQITIADSSLDKELSSCDVETQIAIDNEIYFYVEEGCLELSPEEICKTCLDMPFIFLEDRGE
jgi:hypothetical protein